MVKINGKEENAEGMTVSQYLESKGYDLKRVAVERNGEIVLKSVYNTAVFYEGDVVEVVSFVGGG